MEAMKIVEKEVPEDIKDRVINKMVKEKPDSQVMDDMDIFQTSTSIPNGGKNATQNCLEVKIKKSI